MSNRISLVPCRSARDWKLFESIPEILHGHLDCFLPPFPGSVARIRKPSHPFHTHGELFPFIALRDGRPVGRIAGVINETHNAYHDDNIGFFGFFDFVDDEEVAQVLFDAARTEVARRGRDVLRGPVSPTQNDECGLLVDGFDKQPFILMPYNPEYYVGIYETLGLEKARDLLAYYWDPGIPIMERTARIAERVRRKTKIAFRGIDIKNLPEELEVIEFLFNKTLENEWSFMPASRADLQLTATDLKPIVDPDMVLIAEHEGKPVGFSLILPNVNEFMASARSSKGLLRLARLAWSVFTSKPRSVRLAVLGVLPEFRARGIAAMFFFESVKRAMPRYSHGEISWVQDTNEEIHRTAKAMSLEVYKTYRMYDMELGN